MVVVNSTLMGSLSKDDNDDVSKNVGKKNEFAFLQF